MRKRIEAGAVEDGFVAKGRVYVSMVDNPGTLPDPAPEAEDPNDLDNPTNRPGRCAHAFVLARQVPAHVLVAAVGPDILQNGLMPDSTCICNAEVAREVYL